MNVLGFKRKVIVDNTSAAEKVESTVKRATYKRQTRSMTADTKALGQQLKRIRVNAKATQADVAEKLGLHINTYSSYETGRGVFPAIYVNAFCECFGITPTKLFAYSVDAAPPAKEEPKSADARLDALEQIVMQLIDEQRKKY